MSLCQYWHYKYQKIYLGLFKLCTIFYQSCFWQTWVNIEHFSNDFVHFVSWWPSSLARSHEFASFTKLNELYLDREDPWYCHFLGSKWIKRVFRPQHSQFLKLYFFKLAQIWLLGVPFHRVSHILVQFV